MTNKEKLEALRIILNNIIEEEIICSVYTTTLLQYLPDFVFKSYAEKTINMSDWPYIEGYYHNIIIKVNPYLKWDDGRIFDTNSKLIIDLKKEGIDLTIDDQVELTPKKEKLERRENLPEPSITKIHDLTLNKDIIIPMYRDPYMSNTEFLVCNKSNSLKEGIIYAPYVLALVDEDIRNSTQPEEVVEEIEEKINLRKLSNIKAIICNPISDKNFKKIKKMIKQYYS